MTEHRNVFEKSIRVAEPELWYGQKYITVSLFMLLDGTARILFRSIDDFMVYQDINDWDAEANQEWAKIYLWDNIPENVSLTWLYRHGYKPF